MILAILVSGILSCLCSLVAAVLYYRYRSNKRLKLKTKNGFSKLRQYNWKITMSDDIDPLKTANYLRTMLGPTSPYYFTHEDGAIKQHFL